MPASETADPPVIHCIGDSHVSLFSGLDQIQPIWPKRSRELLPNFRVYHLGPALAFNVLREGSRSQGREKLLEVLDSEVPDGATVLLSFGEIDCRVHLVKQADQQKLGLQEVVDSCLDEYIKLVHELQDRGLRVVVYNAVASWPRARTLNPSKRPAYVTYGSRRQRLEAIQRFNAGARQRCEACGALFLENAQHLMASSKPKSWYFFDNIHLSQQAMPPTLMELAKLLPDLGVEVQEWQPPSLCMRFAHWLSGRRKRALKELEKLRK